MQGSVIRYNYFSFNYLRYSHETGHAEIPIPKTRREKLVNEYRSWLLTSLLSVTCKGTTSGRGTHLSSPKRGFLSHGISLSSPQKGVFEP